MSGYLSIVTGLPSSAPIQAFAGPVDDLYTSFKAYRNNQKPTRNLIHCFNILISMLVGGVILPLVSPGFVQFEVDVGPFMGSEGESASLNNTSPAAKVANAYVGYFIISWAGKAVSFAVCAAIHIHWYNDATWFLNKTRLEQLEAATKIPQGDLQEAFIKIRAQYSCKVTMTAARKSDLEAVMHSLMYDDPDIAVKTYNDHVHSLNAVRNVVTNILPQYQLSCLPTANAASIATPQQIATSTNPTSIAKPNGLFAV